MMLSLDWTGFSLRDSTLLSPVNMKKRAMELIILIKYTEKIINWYPGLRHSEGKKSNERNNKDERKRKKGKERKKAKERMEKKKKMKEIRGNKKKLIGKKRSFFQKLRKINYPDLTHHLLDYWMLSLMMIYWYFWSSPFEYDQVMYMHLYGTD